jgi:photosystem II stability/assembly factor-like uncharacterized protein
MGCLRSKLRLSPLVRDNISSMKNLAWLRLGIITLMALATNAHLLYAQDKTSGPWVMQSSGTTAGLRGIHAVGGGVAWASGTDGTVLRTEDSGYMWQRCAMPPGAENLDFRGIWAWDANTAIVMSSGPGDLSRIYKTTDGCSHWTLVMTNPDKDGFWDAMVFKDLPRMPDGSSGGWILGDPVKREFQLFHTESSGKRWILERGKAPRAEPISQETFAASNSAFVLLPDYYGNPFFPAFGTGGTAGAFFYRGGMTICVDDCSESSSPERFGNWTRVSVPVAGGAESSGIFSLAFRDEKRGMAVGGDYAKPNDSSGTVAWTADGGQHWTAAQRAPHGYRSAVTWDADAKAWIAVGTNGSDVSFDDGKTWSPLDNGNWNALSLPWVVGPQGRIAKLDADKLRQK